MNVTELKSLHEYPGAFDILVQQSGITTIGAAEAWGKKQIEKHGEGEVFFVKHKQRVYYVHPVQIPEAVEVDLDMLEEE